MTAPAGPQVDIRLLDTPAGALLAKADVHGSTMILRGWAVMRSREPGAPPWVAPPATKNGTGAWSNVVEVTDPQVKAMISAAVLAAFEKALAERQAPAAPAGEPDAGLGF